MRISKGRLFLSYAREDEQLAARLRDHLVQNRFTVFVDDDELLAGERFADRLQSELAQSDGIVFLHSSHSAESEWCKAEINAAIALKLQILRIVLPSASPLSDPLERLVSGVHFLEWNGTDDLSLADHLRTARSRANLRHIRRAAAFSVIPVAFGILAYFLISGWAEWQHAQLRSAVMESVSTSSSAWSATRVAQQVEDLNGDTELLARIRILSDNPLAPVPVRFNAWQIDQYLSAAQERRFRRDLSGTEWTGGSLSSAFLADTTFRLGIIDSLSIDNCTVAGVYFGAQPEASEPGMSIVGSTFDKCQFWYVVFDRTQMIDVEFRDSRFRAAQLAVEGLAAVRFTSSPATAVLTQHFALFEDSRIEGLPEMPGPGVVDLAEPEHEVIFDGVEFVRSQFVGNFKPGWFRNSHFVDCVFPSDFPLAAIAAGSNRIENASIAP